MPKLIEFFLLKLYKMRITPRNTGIQEYLCTTLNKSQPVENRITSTGWLLKPSGYLKDCA